MKVPPLERRSVFKKKQPIDTSEVDEAIRECYAGLKSIDPDAKEHAKVVKQIAELEKIKKFTERKPTIQFTPDALLTAGVSLLGILLILNYERADSVTTKAISFVTKPKI